MNTEVDDVNAQTPGWLKYHSNKQNNLPTPPLQKEIKHVHKKKLIWRSRAMAHWII